MDPSQNPNVFHATTIISVRRDEDIVNWVKENTFNGFAPGRDPAIRGTT